MFEKNGKYYADWRDKRGKRHRKSFKSPRAALQFEQEQRPKRQAARKPSPRSSPPRTEGATPRTGTPRASSSQRREASIHRASVKPMQLKSTRPSKIPASLTAQRRATHAKRAKFLNGSMKLGERRDSKHSSANTQASDHERSRRSVLKWTPR